MGTFEGNKKSGTFKVPLRYDRQALFYHIGAYGQKKLLESRVTILGCGGLGSVSANSLARAGIGNLRLVDKDVVDFSNLGRQVLYDEIDASKNRPKALAAGQKLRMINSEINIEVHEADINPGNIKKFLRGSDIIIDGTDNLETRLLINETCIKEKIPWVYGSVAASYGMAAAIIPGITPCFYCIFGSESTQHNIYSESSSNVGILNTAVNVVSSIQCAEAIKYLTGNFKAITEGLIIFDIWELSLDIIAISNKKGYRCPICSYSFD
jgi:adenylyltransferase/sulfurtransferase